jgi:hypothetical protein
MAERDEPFFCQHRLDISGDRSPHFGWYKLFLYKKYKDNYCNHARDEREVEHTTKPYKWKERKSDQRTNYCACLVQRSVQPKGAGNLYFGYRLAYQRIPRSSPYPLTYPVCRSHYKYICPTTCHKKWLAYSRQGVPDQHKRLSLLHLVGGGPRCHPGGITQHFCHSLHEPKKCP